jgi:hypothetical protein
MGPYERIGFLLFLSGGLVYFLLIWPTLTNNDRKSYYVGGHKLWFVYYWGIYYFFDLAAYRRKRLREGKPLFVWWVSITIVILFVLWLIAGFVFLFSLILSGQLGQWIEKRGAN